MTHLTQLVAAERQRELAAAARRPRLPVARRERPRRRLVSWRRSVAPAATIPARCPPA